MSGRDASALTRPVSRCHFPLTPCRPAEAIRLQPVDVHEAIAGHQGIHRYRQRRASAQVERAPGKHASPQARAGRYVHVDQRRAFFRVFRRRTGAHHARYRRAIGGVDGHRTAGFHAQYIPGTQFGLPFQPALTNQPEQLRPRGRHRAHRGGARRDHAVVRRTQFDVLPGLLLRCQRGLRRAHPRPGRPAGRQILFDLLRTQGIGATQPAGTAYIGLGLGCRRLRLGQGGPGLGDVGGHGLPIETGQHIAALHRIAHIHEYRRQRQGIGLGSDAGFLPRRHSAIGQHLHRQLRLNRLGHRHHGSRPLWRRLVITCLSGLEQVRTEQEHAA